MDLYFLCLLGILVSYLYEVKGDNCDTCRRRPHTCEIVRGEFVKLKLRQGYNLIKTLPAGVCSVNITETQPSSNYIALKTSSGRDILNSQWSVISPGTYSRAGTIIKYGRGRDSNCKGECVLILGPTNETIEFQLLTYHTNPGILYEYKIFGAKRTDIKKHNGRRHQSNRRHHRYHSHRRRNKNLSSRYISLGNTQPFSISNNGDSARNNAHKKSKHKTVSHSGTATEIFTSQNVENKQTFHGLFPQVKSSSLRPAANLLDKSYKPTSTPSNMNLGSQGQRVTNARKPQRQRKSRKHQRGYQEFSLGETGYYVNPGANKRPKSTVLQNSWRYVPESGYYVRVDNSQKLPNNNRGAIPYRENLHHTPGNPSQHVKPYRNTAWEEPTIPINRGYQVKPIAGEFPAVRVQEGPRYVSPHEEDQMFAKVQSLSNGDSNKDGVQLPDSLFDYNPPNVEPSLGTSLPLPEDRGGQNQPFLPAENSFVVSPQLPDRDYSHGQQVRTIEYSWRIRGFTPCSLECGGGIQETVTICVKGHSEAHVTEDNCDLRLKPTPQQVQCNTKPCPPQWKSGNWSVCSVTCGSGLQHRRVECTKRVTLELQLSVSADKCSDSAKPSISQQCLSDPCAKWKVESWKSCSVSCGRGERKRRVICVDNNNNPIPEGHCKDQRPTSTESCHRGPCTKQWFYTNWNDQCSSDCGSGFTSRQVLCLSNDGRVLKGKRCDHGIKPESQKSCQTNRLCGGQWFTGPWKKCSSMCGKGLTTREVICMKNIGGGSSVPVSEDNCLETDKPDAEKICEGKDCGVHWFMTDWTKCSVSCGRGEQSREVMCLDGDRSLSSDCDEDIEPSSNQQCSLPECNISKIDSSCKDELSNCIVVAQARLCRYRFYKTVCCETCSKNHH